MNTVNKMTAKSILFIPPLNSARFRPYRLFQDSNDPEQDQNPQHEKMRRPDQQNLVHGSEDGSKKERNYRLASRQDAGQNARDQNHDEDCGMEDSLCYASAEFELTRFHDL